MIDDADTVPEKATLAADLCIVGAGAAGITLALQFLNTGHSVILLESGALKQVAATQALYEGEVVNERLHSPPDKYRQRSFGGSTNIWGGRCVPLDPIDFERRSFVQSSGWPIAYDDVVKHYPQANALCEAGEYEYHADKAVPGGMKPMIKGFEPESFTTDTLERFSYPTNFGERYRKPLAESQNIRVLLNANCTEIIAAQDKAIAERLVIRTLSGRTFHIEAKRVVLAMGGLEIPRLLLASRKVHRDGIGNEAGLVGRYYMCHIAGTLGVLRFDAPKDDIWHGYDVAPDGVYCRRRIAMKPEVQRKYEAGNIVLRLHHPRIPNPEHRTGALSAIYLAKHFIRYEYSKRLHGEERLSMRDWLRHCANVASDPFATAGFLQHWVRKRILAKRKFPSIIIRPRANIFSLDFHGEQEPNPESRITLANTADALGMPRICVDWRYTENDIRMVTTALKLLQEDFARWGKGRLEYETDGIESLILRDGAYGGHHIGTARMGATQREGVVNADCRLHGMENLYVAGSAVFPTSGQANPTLNIVALALRLAAHLKKEMSHV